MFEDLRLVLDCFASFVAGLLGLDPKTVVGGLVAATGTMATLMSRRIGHVGRSVAGKTYSAAKWCLSANELTPAGKTLLTLLESNARLDKSGLNMLVYDRFRFKMDPSGRVRKIDFINETSSPMPVEVLSKYDRKVIERRAADMYASLKASLEEANRVYVATFLDSIQQQIDLRSQTEVSEVKPSN
jgi:hypothetical protein